jgi:Flp pilus assembly pilin Flp
MVRPVSRLIQQTDAQDLIEYALLTSLVSLAVMAGVGALGAGVGALSSSVFGRAVAALMSGS